MDTAEELRALRAEVADLRRQLDRIAGTPAQLAPPQRRRFVKTIEDPTAETYPTENSEAKCFWVVFVEPTYTNTDDGSCSLTTTDRQSEGCAIVHNVKGWVPEGTYLLIDWDPWTSRWIVSESPGPFLGVLDEDLEEDSDADVSIYTGHAPSHDTTFTINAHDWFADDTIDSGTRAAITWFPENLRFYVTAAEC